MLYAGLNTKGFKLETLWMRNVFFIYLSVQKEGHVLCDTGNTYSNGMNWDIWKLQAEGHHYN